MTDHITPATADDLEALADSLSACADELHARLMRAIRLRPPALPADAPAPDPASGPVSGPAPWPAAAAAIPAAPGPAAATAIPAPPPGIDQGISQGAAQALFENEVALRQRANGLYLDAAELAASGLGGLQSQLLDLSAQARETIRKVNRLKDLIGITAELLALGAAIADRKPSHISSSYTQLKSLLDDLHRQQSNPPPSA